MKRIGTLLAHGTIIFSLILVVLLVVDHLNPTMDFLNNAGAKLFILLLCLCGLLSSVIHIITVRQR